MRKLAFLAIVGLLTTGGATLAAEEGGTQVAQPPAQPVNHPASVKASNGAPVTSNGGIAYGIGMLESTSPGGPSAPFGSTSGSGAGGKS